LAAPRAGVRVSVVATSMSAVALLSVVVGCGASSGGAVANDAARTQNVVTANIAKPALKESAPMVAAALDTSTADEAHGPCRAGMVSIEGRFCIDKYEASLVETSSRPGDEEKQFSPYAQVHDEHVRAVSEPGVVPQGYISRNQAEKACQASGKRLCQVQEWQQACRGPEKKQWGYGDAQVPGRCNDKGKNPVLTYYGPRYDATTMNKPELNQMSGTLSKTGEHQGCSNGYGVYDMVGNLHEWVADPNGTFYGGYYQDVDTVGHGAGCGYKTTAHEARYHDYSTGFRCCADMPGSESKVEVAPAVDPPVQPAAIAPKPKKKKLKKR